MSGNILVVDDDKEIVQAIAINLEQEGFRVFKAYDGLEALEIAMSQDLQLIIIDVMMPKLDGLSAVLKIRFLIYSIGKIFPQRGHALFS